MVYLFLILVYIIFIGDDGMEEPIIYKKQFGMRIREARKKMGYTQFQLAEKLGISENFLGDIERGTKLLSIEKLILIANVLKVSLDSLLADSLNTYIGESEEMYYSDKQLAIMKSLIQAIQDNF